MNDRFAGYAGVSGHADGFPLLTTFKTPKPCARRSAISPVIPKYFIGQKELTQTSSQLDLASEFADLKNAPTWIFLNGTLATDQIGKYSNWDKTFHI